MSSLKDTLLQQKKEKEGLLAKPYVPREKLAPAARYLGSDLIKVVLGPRRAGKSVFCLLLLQGKDFAYVNFDDENLVRVTTDELLAGVFEVYAKPQFMLLDEIQNLPNWELFVNKLQR